MISHKITLKTLMISMLLITTVIADQPQKQDSKEPKFYFINSATHKSIKLKDRKTTFREPLRKNRRFQKIDNSFIEKAYKALQKKEETLQYSATDEVLEYNDRLVNQVKSGRPIKRYFKGLDFMGCFFDQAVANMLSILQNKLDCIGDIYQPKRKSFLENSSDEESADPYYTNLCMDYKNNVYYHFTLNYNRNGKNNKQPGNSVIRQSIEWGKKNRDSFCVNYSREDYSFYLQDNEDLKELLMSLEVARRKVVDKEIGLVDNFSDLPIFYASKMAISLLDTGNIFEEQFWINTRKYHMYTGEKTEREAGIKNIIRQYISIHNIKDINELLESFE